MIVDKDIVISHSTENKPVDGFGLGRIFAFDSRDRKFLMVAPAAQSIEIRSRHWITAKPLDQGSKPHCVAFATAQFLLSAPVVNKSFPSTDEIYRLCQDNDEWPGSAYDGTSGRAAMKVMRDLGYVKEWQNAFEIDTVIRHVLAVSPVLIGVNWYQGMFSTDRNGFIKVAGRLSGGHEVMIKGVNLDTVCPDGSRGAVRIINSWGDWGDGGKCWLSFGELSRLIAENGEALAAHELKFQKRIV